MQTDHVINMSILSPQEREQPTSALMGNRAEDNFFAKAIGREIYRLRKSQSMSGKDLGARLNISQQQVSRYERAVCHITMDNLIVVLAILGVSWDEFFKHVFMRVSENEEMPEYYSNIISTSPILSNIDNMMR